VPTLSFSNQEHLSPINAQGELLETFVSKKKKNGRTSSRGSRVLELVNDFLNGRDLLRVKLVEGSRIDGDANVASARVHDEWALQQVIPLF
jgi:hypothetical protein